MWDVSQIDHAIRTELALDKLNMDSLQAIDTLVEMQNVLQRQVLQVFRDEHERELLVNMLRVNQGALQAIQNLLLGVQSLSADLPQLSQALSERRFHTVFATHGQQIADVERAMREESLSVEPMVTPSRLPLIGSLITRVKRAYHALVLFYLRQFASKQAQVNRVYGGCLLSLLRDMAENEEKVRSLEQNQCR